LQHPHKGTQDLKPLIGMGMPLNLGKLGKEVSKVRLAQGSLQ